MFSAALYARARTFCPHCARDREYTSSCRHPRRRVTQYSRDASDRTEKPRRTGYPAGACHRAAIRPTGWRVTTVLYVAAPYPSLRGALATKQSIFLRRDMDCFASLAMMEGMGLRDPMARNEVETANPDLIAPQLCGQTRARN